MADYRGAGQVFVTHGHFDHIYHIPQIYKGTQTVIHCTKTPRKTLLGKGMDPASLQEICPGWTGKYGPFTVTAYQGRHCEFDLPLVAHTILRADLFRHLPRALWLELLRAEYPEQGEILFYEVSCQGLRLQIMGSMGLDARTVYPTGADVLLLPLQGRSDQDEYALRFVERLKPKAVLLDHYNNSFPPISQDVDVSGFVKNCKTRFGIPCRALQVGETITFGEEV
jgi:L-ascorbate metabolism protein UlaG (beta-lactamase superfamily)